MIARHRADDSRSAPGEVPLVLLPGMNCSARLWSRLEVDTAITPSLTEPTLAGQVERLLDELPGRFALAGLSLGGIVAMALARTAPERIERLCLMATNPYEPTIQQRTAWSQQRQELAAGRSARDLQAELLPMLLSPAVMTAQAGVVELTLRMADEVGAAQLDAQLCLQGTRIDERPALRELTRPTMIVAARNDLLCSVDRHLELARLIAGSTLIVVEHAAHLVPLERPDELARAMRHWLSPQPSDIRLR